MPLSSRISSASEEDVDLIFSPVTNEPVTVVRTIVFPVVSDWMKPVAPEVTPVTFEPVLVPAEGVADIVSFVNIRMSKRYNLYSASAVITSTPEPVSFAECSNALTRASPTLLPAGVPNEEVCWSCNAI